MAKRSEGPRITLTEGSIRVHWGARILTILPASSPPKAEDPADFTVDLDSILTWDAPHGDIEIEIEVAELQKIAQAIEQEFEKLGLVVEFD
jgi:Immunity protein 74